MLKQLVAPVIILIAVAIFARGGKPCRLRFRAGSGGNNSRLMTVLREQQCLQTLGSLINQRRRFPAPVARLATRAERNGASGISAVQKYFCRHFDAARGEEKSRVRSGKVNRQRIGAWGGGVGDMQNINGKLEWRRWRKMTTFSSC